MNKSSGVMISLEWPHPHAGDGVLGGGGRTARVQPENGYRVGSNLQIEKL